MGDAVMGDPTWPTPIADTFDSEFSWFKQVEFIDFYPSLFGFRLFFFIPSYL